MKLQYQRPVPLTESWTAEGQQVCLIHPYSIFNLMRTKLVVFNSNMFFFCFSWLWALWALWAVFGNQCRWPSKRATMQIAPSYRASPMDQLDWLFICLVMRPGRNNQTTVFFSESTLKAFEFLVALNAWNPGRHPNEDNLVENLCKRYSQGVGLRQVIGFLIFFLVASWLFLKLIYMNNEWCTLTSYNSWPQVLSLERCFPSVSMSQ